MTSGGSATTSPNAWASCPRSNVPGTTQGDADGYGRGERIAGFGIRVLNDLTGGRFVTLARSDLSRLLFDRIKDRTEAIFGDEIAALKDECGGPAERLIFRAGRDRHNAEID